MKKQLQQISHRTIPILFTLTLILASMIGMAQTAYVPTTNGKVFIINVATNTVIDSIKLSSGFGGGVAVSIDGNKVYIANQASNKISVINTASNTISDSIIVSNGQNCVAISPDGSQLYATVGADSVDVINTTTHAILASIKVGMGPYGICVTPDGSKVYIVSGDDSVSVINTSSNAVVATIIVGFNPLGICVSPDGSKVYVTSSGDTTVTVISTAADTVLAKIKVASKTELWGICVSPDGSKLYITDHYYNKVYVLNTVNNTVSAIISVGVDPWGISITPDGTKVYVANYATKVVSVINTATNTVADSIQLGHVQQSIGNFISTHQYVGIPAYSIDASSISIYPNPFTSQTTISFSAEQINTTISITDLLGKEIKLMNFSGKELTLERGEMSSGIYFVQITDDKQNVVNKKIVVQ